MSNAEIDAINSVLAEQNDRLVMNLDNDKDPDAVNYKLMWQQIKKRALALHEWNFGSKYVELNPITAPTIGGYKYVFEMPSDRLGVVAQVNNVGYNVNSPTSQHLTSGYTTGLSGQNYGEIHIEGEYIYGNESPLRIVYAYDVPYNDCPGHFQEVILAEFRSSVQIRNFGRASPTAERYRVEVLRMARNINWKSEPVERVYGGFLISASRGGWRASRIGRV